LRTRKVLRSEAAEPGEPGWKAALAHAVALIAALGVARASVSVVLSNRFARYLLLPASPALRKQADWQAFAQQRLADLHGPEAAACTVLLSTGGRAARVACAVDAALIEAVRASLGAAGHRLVCLRPRFAAWFDGNRRGAGHTGAWFVDHDAGQLTLGLAVAGEWRSLRQRRAGRNWPAQLDGMLDRETELCGAARVDRAYVAAPHPLPERLGRYAVIGMASA
jgi:hypothetical protein